MPNEHTIVGSRPKKRRGTLFYVDEFKVDGKIKEEKPLVVTLGSDRGGGKFNIPILS